MKLLNLVCFGLLLGYGSANAAPSVTVNDAACGDLSSLELNNGTLSVNTTDTACAQTSSTGTFSVPDKTITEMNEGTSQSVDVAADSSGNTGTIVLKQVLNSRLGSVPSASGTSVTYSAPLVGEAGDSDYFYFMLEDAATPYPNIAVGKVIIARINDVGATSSACVDTTSITCMGTLAWMGNNGKHLDQTFTGIGNIHVWKLDFVAGSRVLLSIVDADLIETSVSLTPGDMTTTLSGNCIGGPSIELSQTIVDASVGQSWECNVPIDASTGTGTIYYNIKMVGEGNNGGFNEYDITWVDQS